jgi:hypothetical protein
MLTTVAFQHSEQKAIGFMIMTWGNQYVSSPESLSITGPNCGGPTSRSEGLPCIQDIKFVDLNIKT